MTKKIVIGFGRFNPVTIGHEKIYDQIISKSDNYQKYLIVTSTRDKKKNPLTIDQKLKYLNKAFPNINIIVSDKTGLIETLKQFSPVDQLTIICGDDRIDEFKERICLYNNQLYQFNNIDFISSGERDNNQISGTKMREFVKKDDFNSFSQYCPSRFTNQDIKDIYQDLRKVLV